MKPELPDARIAGRGDRDNVLRGIGIAIAVGAAGVVASWSLLLAFVFVGLGVGGGGLWLFRLYLDAREARGPATVEVEAVLPTATCEYALRPRLSRIAVMIVSLMICVVAICLVVIRWPDLGELSIVAAVMFMAGFCGALVTFHSVRAWILRQRVVVTETHVLVPRSVWSRRESSIELEYVGLRTWGPDESPVLEISGIGGGEYDVGMDLLGERAFRELVAVLEHRVARAKAQQPRR